MTRTTAAVLRGPMDRFSFEEVDLVDIGPKDVLIRILSVGYCHTDHIARGAASYVLPAILGHEGCGIVVDVGDEVISVSIDDTVVLTFASCGHCTQCAVGRPSYCEQFGALNLQGGALGWAPSATDAEGNAVASRWFGQSSFAHHAVVNERGVVLVSSDVPSEFLGPLACGIQTGAATVLSEMKLKRGQTIAVFGAGAVGLAAVMAAKMVGAADIVASDIHQSRLDLALELGATRSVLASGADQREDILGGTRGLDFALDTTGVDSVMRTAVHVVGAGGQIHLVGAGDHTIALHPSELAGKRLTYVVEGGVDPQRFIPLLIELWRSGEFPFDRLITTYPFDQIDQAEEASNNGSVIKPVLVMG